MPGPTSRKKSDEINFEGKAGRLAQELASGELCDESTREICMGRPFTLYVPSYVDHIATKDVIALIRGLRLASKSDRDYVIALDLLHEHYGEQLSGGAFANLFETILLDATTDA